MPFSLIRLWLGPLPVQEIYPEHRVNPAIHWFFHPLKRRLAKYYVRYLQAFHGLKVIAVTGSVGKTTTKDMLSSVLSSAAPTVASQANINSTFNIPATILRAGPQTRFLILEMGVEYPGDMDFYNWLVRPDAAVITSVDRTHTHYLKSVAQVGAEKGKIFRRLPRSGFAVFNADDPNITVRTHARTYAFGHNPESYCSIIKSYINSDLKTTVHLLVNNQPVIVHLPVLGSHFASNAAAVMTIASLFGIEYSRAVSALESFTPPPHRLHPVRTLKGPVIIDDSYNANPRATLKSLDTLAEVSRLLKKTPVFVFGQMNELGPYEQEAHEEIGRHIKKLGIKRLFTTGPATRHTIAAAGFGQHFPTRDDLAKYLQKNLGPSYVVLVKASRSYHFEDLVAAITHS